MICDPIQRGKGYLYNHRLLKCWYLATKVRILTRPLSVANCFWWCIVILILLQIFQSKHNFTKQLFSDRGEVGRFDQPGRIDHNIKTLFFIYYTNNFRLWHNISLINYFMFTLKQFATINYQKTISNWKWSCQNSNFCHYRCQHFKSL